MSQENVEVVRKSLEALNPDLDCGDGVLASRDRLARH